MIGAAVEPWPPLEVLLLLELLFTDGFVELTGRRYAIHRSSNNTTIATATIIRESNMGHSELTIGIAALIKMLISIQRGVNIIPTNLHYQQHQQQ